MSLAPALLATVLVTTKKVFNLVTLRGADPNANNKNGETPLHLACKCLADSIIEVNHSEFLCSCFKTFFIDVECVTLVLPSRFHVLQTLKRILALG